jgi:hypothetical protein
VNAASNDAAVRGLRGWWASPPRSGAQLLINPIAYRHLRFFGVMHLVGSTLATVAGLICLAYLAYPWAAFFLILGALNLGGGSWYISIARSRSAVT